MLARLAKLAETSQTLRKAHLSKAAGLGAAMGMASKAVAKPFATGLAAYGAYSNIKGGVGQYRQNEAGFRPEVHQRMLGQTPKPPGT